MKKSNAWPRKVTVGNCSVTVYRTRRARTSSGYEFLVVWHAKDGGRAQRSFAKEEDALDQAEAIAEHIHSGRAAADHISDADKDEWARAIELAGDTPLLTAMREWATAQDLTGGQLIPAARAWAERYRTGEESVSVNEAVDRYLKAREADGILINRGPLQTFNPTRVPPQRRSFREAFGNRMLGEVTPNQIAAWLETQPSAVSRNFHRKHLVALWRWCRRRGYLPAELQTAAEKTDKARETHGEIGTISARDLADLFRLIAREHPHYVPSLTLAALCGMRRAEVQGQKWEDIHIDRGFLRVSTAKPRTPSRRQVPLCDAARAWLLRHARGEGAVCDNLAIDRLRDIARTAGFSLARNGFRHTWISARVEITGDIPRTALEAGTSVAKIHQHYRELLRPEEAAAWFAVMPQALPAAIDVADTSLRAT